MKNLDVIIIGAGTAGLSAQKAVARKTKNYLVIDKGPLGTTCARVGCMPSKALIEVALAVGAGQKLKKAGLVRGPLPQLAVGLITRHVRKLRDRFVAGVLKDMREWRKTHLLEAEARIIGPGLVEADGRLYRARTLIVATGTAPVWPKAWSQNRKYMWTSDEIFEVRQWPSKLAVIGSGAVGLELASALALFGVKVSMFGNLKRLGGLTDPAVLKKARAHFGKQFAMEDGNVTSVADRKGGVRIVKGRRRKAFGGALLAMGRESQLPGLGVEAGGVHLDEKGWPQLDEHHMKAHGHALFVVGDANRRRPLLHEANDQGRYAGQMACLLAASGSGKPVTLPKYEPKTRLAIAFTSPQIAVVGASFAELTEEGAIFVVGSLDFQGQGRALTKLENVGMIRVYGCRKTGKVFGAEIFGPSAEHIAHLLAWAIDAGETVFDLLRKAFYHPTLEEGLRTALRNLAKQVEADAAERDDALRTEPVAGTNCP